MKTLKITLALVAVLVLTVSGVQSENVIENVVQEEIKSPSKIDLLAHGKKNMKLPTQG